MNHFRGYRRIPLVLLFIALLCNLAEAQGQEETFITTFQYVGDITGVNKIAWGLAAGDLNEDGYPDFVVGEKINNSEGRVTIFLNNEGTGDFIKHDPSIITRTRPYGIALADLDEDSHLDIIITEGGADGKVLVCYSNGSLLDFEDQTPITQPPSYDIGIATGDPDNDGDIDIFIGGSRGQIQLITNQGQKSFAFPRILLELGDHEKAYGLDTGDIDQDGYLDVIVGSTNGEVQVFYGNALGSYDQREYAPIGMLNPLPLGVVGDRHAIVGRYAYGLAVADMNDDGFLDVLIGDGSTSTVRYFEGGASSNFELAGIVATGLTNPFGVATADFDQDGDIDVLIGSQSYPDLGPVSLFWNVESRQEIIQDEFLKFSKTQRMQVYMLVIASTTIVAIAGMIYFIAKEIDRRRITWVEFSSEIWQILKISFSYAIVSIWHGKRRAITLIIGFTIGTALISSFVVWQDTAPRVAIKDALADRNFEMIAEPGFPWVSDHLLENVSRWLMAQPLVENTEIAYSTCGLFGAHGLSQNHYFGISGFGAYSPPGILITDYETIFLVNETYLDIVADQFLVQGDLKVDNETVILSDQLVSRINQTTGLWLEVGSYFNFTIAGSRPTHADRGPVYYGNFTPIEFTNLRVGAIYARIPEKSPIALEFAPETLTDGLILSRSLVTYDAEVILEETMVLPKLFIRANRNEISKLSPREVISALEGLKGVLTRVFPSLQVTIYAEHLSEKVDRFWQTSVVILFLLIPSVVLAGYLTVFSVDLVTRSRSPEIGILKSRGADHWELVTMFSFEYGILALMGTLFGTLFLGVLISASISAFSTNYSLDVTVLLEFMSEVKVSPFALGAASIYSFVILAMVILRQVRFFLSLDVSEALQSTTRRRIEFLKQWHLDFVLSVAAFTAWAITLMSGSSERLFGLPADDSRTALLLIGVIIWFALAFSSGRLIVSILPTLMNWFQVLLGAKAKFVTENYSRRGQHIAPVIITFILIFSIGAFVFETSEMVRNNAQNELSYLIGCDTKVFTAPNTPINFTRTLSAQSGVKNATAVLQTTGTIGSFEIALMGLETGLYWDIGRWGKTHFADGFNYDAVLQSINSYGPFSNLTNQGSLSELTIEVALKIMEKSQGYLLLNAWLAKLLRVEPGEKITIYSIGSAWDRSQEFTILGILKTAPGFGELNSGQKFSSEYLANDGGVAIISSDFLTSHYNYNTASFFMVSLHDGASLETITINFEGRKEVFAVYTADYSKEEAQHFVRFLGISGITIVSFACSLAFAVLCLTIFLDFMIDERRREYAIMRAAGAKKGQIRTLILFEFFGMLVPGFLFGLILGTCLSVMFVILSDQLLVYFGILPFVIKPITQPIIIVAALSFMVSLVTLLLGAFFPARRAARSDVALVLKNA